VCVARIQPGIVNSSEKPCFCRAEFLLKTLSASERRKNYSLQKYNVTEYRYERLLTACFFNSHWGNKFELPVPCLSSRDSSMNAAASIDTKGICSQIFGGNDCKTKVVQPNITVSLCTFKLSETRSEINTSG